MKQSDWDSKNTCTLYTWTQTNNLSLNADKTTFTFFTPDPAEYSTTNKQRYTTQKII